MCYVSRAALETGSRYETPRIEATRRQQACSKQCRSKTLSALHLKLLLIWELVCKAREVTNCCGGDYTILLGIAIILDDQASSLQVLHSTRGIKEKWMEHGVAGDKGFPT